MAYNNVQRSVSTVDFTELRRFKYVDTRRSTPDLYLRVEKSIYVDVTGNINSNEESRDSNEETRGSNEETLVPTKSDIEINKQHDIKPNGFLRNIGKFFIGLSCWRKNIN